MQDPGHGTKFSCDTSSSFINYVSTIVLGLNVLQLDLKVSG